MANGFRYEFTGKELVYFLFGRKKCPECGTKMKKTKRFRTVDGAKFNTASVPLYIKGRKIKEYYYLFICDKCGSEYELKDLVNYERRF